MTLMTTTHPGSTMSEGGTFIRPGAVGWGLGGKAQPDGGRTNPNSSAVIEHALAAAVKDPDRVTDLLDELSRGKLWLPLPDDRPVTDGSAVLLPTVTYLGAEFVPAFTSAQRLADWLGRPLAQSPVPAPSPGRPRVLCRPRVRARPTLPAARRAMSRSRPCRTSWSPPPNWPG